MLYDQYGITQVTQPPQYCHQAFGIAGVQSYTGLVQDVQTGGQVTPQGTRQVDALALPTR